MVDRESVQFQQPFERDEIHGEIKLDQRLAFLQVFYGRHIIHRQVQVLHRLEFAHVFYESVASRSQSTSRATRAPERRTYLWDQIIVE